MEKIVLLLLVVTMLTAEASAYKQEDLDKLQDTYNCVKCDLRGAILREANLTGANLYKADLMSANLRGARFCRTTMPDGSINNDDC